MNKNNTVVLHVTNLSKINCGAAVSLLKGLRIVGNSIQQKVYLTKDGELASEIREIIGEENVLTGLYISYKKENHIRGYSKLLEIKAFRYAIKKFKPDVIHLNSLETLFPLGWASVLSGTPVIGHQRETYRGKTDSFVLRLLKRIISISNYVENSLPSHLKQKAVTIYNPISLNNNNSSKNIEDRKNIVYLGRISKEKGPDLLLDAFINIHNSIDANLVIAGFDSSSADENYAASMREKLEKLPVNLKNRIKLISWVSDVEEIFNTTCLLVVPSRVKEGLGRSALEAMSYGVPVVAANNGGLIEVVEDGVTGYLFEPDNVYDLQEKIKIICIDTAKRKEMANKSKSRILEKFNDQTYLNNIITQYHKIANDQSPTG